MSKQLKIIAAMNNERIIGKDNDIPWRGLFEEDLKRFRRKTEYSTVIMGRKTWESLQFKPLINRDNIIITKKIYADIRTANSIVSAIEKARYNTIWCIGGSQLYSDALLIANEIDMTIIPHEVSISGTNVYFPMIDTDVWREVSRINNKHDKRIVHVIYRRKDKVKTMSENRFNLTEPERTKWELVVEAVNSMKVDAAKCYGDGNKAAGKRLRKSLRNLRILAKKCRQETLDLEKQE